MSCKWGLDTEQSWILLFSALVWVDSHPIDFYFEYESLKPCQQQRHFLKPSCLC